MVQRSPQSNFQSPSDRPVMVWDGDCRFCGRWIRRWSRFTGDRIEYLPSREAAGSFPHLGDEDFSRAVYLIEPDGTTTFGAEAVLRTMFLCGRCRLWYRLYQRNSWFAAFSEWCYRRVANNRRLLSWIT